MFNVTIGKQGERELINVDNVFFINTTENGDTLKLQRFCDGNLYEKYPLNMYYLHSISHVEEKNSFVEYMKKQQSEPLYQAIVSYRRADEVEKYFKRKKEHYDIHDDIPEIRFYKDELIEILEDVRDNDQGDLNGVLYFFKKYMSPPENINQFFIEKVNDMLKHLKCI